MNLDIVSFIVGIFSSIIFPLIIYVKNYTVKKYERRSFRLMINKEYLKPLIKVFDEDLSAYETRKRIKGQISDIVKKIDYLKKEELPFLTTDNQFYFIRVVEYTLRLSKKIYDTNIEANDLKSKVGYELKIKSYIEYYENNVDKYADLQTDIFQTPD
ncbi:hypothetical protein ABG980_08755 [Enterococcus casseliflavus]|uniref:hypothetical protein n=1 Tax=Enterococcus casseliflavus TaxID=37734 RepID=UPI00232EE791|nr:hypothetical protein [Enterococcus casseliflavus]MDB1695149.1 hypothetical protein [Enterococcus casseliflavus]MDB1698581.1 hypothetical protein [Enterococcus casseliflavus]MDB1700628.1 hypothetical protein [Enterococcus casseliflavus]MDB1705642.1 hypothetical protein [Enterococcus casseliflavus]